MERATDPFRVGLLAGQEMPEPAVRAGVRDSPKLQHFTHHQQHDQAPVGIQRRQSLGGRSYFLTSPSNSGCWFNGGNGIHGIEWIRVCRIVPEIPGAEKG